MGTWQGWKVLGDLKFSCDQFRFQRVCSATCAPEEATPDHSLPRFQRGQRAGRGERASELSAAEGSQAPSAQCRYKAHFPAGSFSAAWISTCF